MDDKDYSSKIFNSLDFIYKIKENIYYLLFVFEIILFINIFISIGGFNYFKITASWKSFFGFFNPLHFFSFIAFFGFSYFILKKIYQFILIYLMYIDKKYEKIKNIVNNNLRKNIKEFDESDNGTIKKNTNVFIFTCIYITDLFYGKESLLNYFNFYINKIINHLNIINSIALILIVTVIAYLYLTKEAFYNKCLSAGDYKIDLKVVKHDLRTFIIDTSKILCLALLLVGLAFFIGLCFYYLLIIFVFLSKFI